ncbi:hypothetical protein [Clostridium sp. Marseille-P299]|uniref:hypothetical protein n=1 Tax=Clostridium sp. Marseille-P299 TaxID=1805477 RepID=UPI0008379661|nr:hypothetical protein [Clostridium sp. Marseille-P299]
MKLQEYMEGYDRSFDEDEFDERLWEFMQSDEFEFGEEFEFFLRDYGINDTHDFLKIIRLKQQLKKNRQ